MGRGFCQRTNYEENFGKVIRGAVFGFGKCKDVEKILGISRTTMSSRFKKPGMMPLKELKMLIRLGGISEEEVVKYLFEKK